MITRILRNTLAEIGKWEAEHLEDAACVRPSLTALRAHMHQVIQYIAQPTAQDLEADETEGRIARNTSPRYRRNTIATSYRLRCARRTMSRARRTSMPFSSPAR